MEDERVCWTNIKVNITLGINQKQKDKSSETKF